MSEENTGAGGDSGGARKVDVVGELKKMPFAEKLLAGASVAIVVVSLIDSFTRGMLFNHMVFYTAAFVAACLILVLVALHILGIEIMPAKTRTYVVVFLALVPVLGIITDMLEHANLWRIIGLAASGAMVFAAMKISNREGLIKKGGD